MKHDAIGMMGADQAKQIALKHVKAEVRLAGLFAETKLEQSYRNDTATNIEVVYTFPLPVDGVLLNFEVALNGTPYRGHVVARSQAETAYEASITEGNAAFRLQKLQSGLYSVSLGNIKAGEEVVIRLMWAEMLPWSGSSIRYRLPTTLAPRYGVPAHLEPWQRPKSDLTVDYPLEVKLMLVGDLSKAKISSPSHSIGVTVGNQGVEVEVSHGGYMDRDFILEVRPEGISSMGILADSDKESVVALNFMPPAFSADADTYVSRRAVIVLDCSGSMAGDSMDLAKEGVILTLLNLRPEDQFAIVAFGDRYQCFDEKILPASRKNISLAKEFVSRLGEMGGTEMGAALKRALQFAKLPSGEKLSGLDILLLTDGEAWNLDQVAARAHREGHRIFSVGVGSAVAEDIVRMLADRTGGACELVSPNEAMAQRIERHFARIRQPRIVDVSVNFGAPVTWESRSSRAVFAGESLSLFAIADTKITSPIEATLHYASGETMHCAIDLCTDDSLSPTLLRMAAQQKMISLPEDSRSDWAIRYQLLSDQTDYLIQVDRAEHDRTDDLPELQVVPQMLAAGWGGTSTVRFSPDRMSFCRSTVSMDFDLPIDDIPAVLFRRAPKQQIDRRDSSDLEPLIQALNKRANALIRSSLPLSIDELKRIGLPTVVLERFERLLRQGLSEQTICRAFLMALSEHQLGQQLSDRFKKKLAKARVLVAVAEALLIEMTEMLDDLQVDVVSNDRYSIPAFLRHQAD